MTQAIQRINKLKQALHLAHYQAVGIVEIVRVITLGGRLVTPLTIAKATEWDGSPDELYTALVECGYLVVIPSNN